MPLERPPRRGTVTRAQNIVACVAGLLRFATPDEVDGLLGVIPDGRARSALRSHGMPNRVVAEALLRRGRHEDLDVLVDATLLGNLEPSMLGRLLDLDDPRVNERILLAESGLTSIPRNLRRQLAHQTSRRDGVTPVPLPEDTRDLLYGAHRQQEPLDHAMLYAADPDIAGHAIRFLGAGADPHGAVQACVTLLDGHRGHELRQLIGNGRLPAYRWGPDLSEPSVLAYAQAALASAEGEQKLRDLSRRVRRAEFLTSVAEIADGDACGPWGVHPVKPWAKGPQVVRTVVNRRHPSIPRVGWDAVLEDEPQRRNAEGPFPLRVARFIAMRTDAPLELVRMAVADHPEAARLVPDPAPGLLAELCAGELRLRPGADVVLKVVGNGFVAGTLTPEFVVETVPEELLADVAESLWLPGMCGTAAIRAFLELSGDVPLTPFFVEETGHGRTRRLREPGRRSHWDAALAYGQQITAYGGKKRWTADEVLSLADADALLAPDRGLPDPRVLRRLAEHVHEQLGGRLEAWMVALRLLEEGFAGTLPELLETAGAVTR
jgi:hypothetical protein